MNVLVLAAAYPGPAEPERAVAVENLTRGMLAARAAGQELRVAVVAPRVAASDPPRELRGGIDVRRFSSPTGGRRLKEIQRPGPLLLGAYALAALWSAVAVGRERAADVLVCHWVLPLGPVAACVAAALNIPLVLVAHGSDIHRYAFGSRLWGAASSWALSRAAAVVAVSEALRRSLVERLGVPPDRVSVLPMGVDERYFGAFGASRDEARAALGLSASERLLLFAGDLLVEKGLPELVEAHEALLGRGIDHTLCVVGQGAWSASLEAAARRGPPGKLRSLGRLSQPDLAVWMRAADLLILPSHGEGSPVTVQEALATGLPVVATRVGGLPELVEDRATGWLVEPRSPPALVAAIDEALRPGALERAREAIRCRPVDRSSGSRARAFCRLLEEVSHGV